MSDGAEQLSFDAVPGRPAPEPEPIVSAFPPTPEQGAAIDSRVRDVFLEAGAGTGKTRVLVDRYCDSVDLDGIDPAQILAFTFTEKAAAEMRRRVRVELARRAREAGDEERRDRLAAAARAGESAPITTIHGFCRRMLAGHPVAAGLDPRFRVLDADESARIAALALERAIDELAERDDDVARLAAGYRDRLGPIVRAAYGDLRNRGRARPELPALQINAFDSADETADPEEVELATASWEALRRVLERFADRYAEAKDERSGVDFDDLQLVALELLRRSHAIAGIYRERYAHLLVDEFQDTSPIQVELIRAIAGPACRVFAVGDEFQSIYAFRGADLASFRRVRERMRSENGPDSVLQLSGSFRSTPDVVATVNAVGASLLDEFRPLRVGREPEARPAGPSGPAVEILVTDRKGWNEEGLEIATGAGEAPASRIAEARFLAARLRELADEGVDPGSMVLLLRAFSNVDAYAEALELAGLDPYIVGGRGYWSAQQVEDALRLLGCVANPLDDESLLGALASPACGVSPDALWMLRKAAGRSRQLWPAVEDRILGPDPDEPPREPPGGATAASEPAPEADPEEVERERERAAWAERIEPADRELIAEFGGHLRRLRRRAPLLPLDSLVEATLAEFGYDLAALTLDGGARRAANLEKLIRIAGEYESHEGRDLRGFLGYAAMRASFSDREAEAAIAAEDHSGVRVMTVHAAKGLEFDCVAVGDLGRGLCANRKPDLRLAFDESDEADDAGEEGEAPAPRVGLRLARAGADGISTQSYEDINADAAASEAEEGGRLAYVAVSRARERLVLSGVADDADIAGREEVKPSHSALARLLPRLGADAGEEVDEQLVEVPAAEPRAGLEASFAPAPIAIRRNRALPESAAALAYDHREAVAEADAGSGARPPLLSLADRGASAARSLSYAALADYRRCGYRFGVERILGVGGGIAAATPTEDVDGRAGDGLEWDEEPVPVGDSADGAEAGAAAEVDIEAVVRRGGIRRERMGFGRAVHGLLEWSARNGWATPPAELVASTLADEGAAPDAGERAGELIGGWLASPLCDQLRDRGGASLRPEVPFRIALGSATVVRGTIDLLVTAEGDAPLVVDYKTDALHGREPASLDAAYELQRELYALAVAEATGAERVESAYVFLERPDVPLRSTLDAAAIAAGRERIEGLIERIREREFAATDLPHAALCHDCPARPRLCPHPRERTLAPAP